MSETHKIFVEKIENGFVIGEIYKKYINTINEIDIHYYLQKYHVPDKFIIEIKFIPQKQE